MGKLVLAENLLKNLSNLPPDGWISIQAVRSMIEREPEADLKEELAKRGKIISSKHVYIKLLKCPTCGKYPQKQKSALTDKPKYYCTCRDTGWCRSDDNARREWNRMVNDG